MTTIVIPSDILNSMKIPRSDQEHVLKLELALALYRRGILAIGPVRRLADISKREFLGELGKRKIERTTLWRIWRRTWPLPKVVCNSSPLIHLLKARPAQPFEGLFPGDISAKRGLDGISRE